MNHPVRTATLLATLILAATLPSCTTDAELPAIPDPTPALAAVIAAQNNVEIDFQDPLYDVEAGRVVDALGTLDGCWAAYGRYYAEADTTGYEVGDPVLDAYAYVEFDSAAGTMSYQSYAAFVDLPLATLVVSEGTYTQEDTNRVVFEIQTITMSDADTGKLVVTQRDETNDNWTETYLVTRDGDLLKLVPVNTENGVETAANEEARVFESFTCVD